MEETEVQQLKDEVKEMFYHGYDNYMKYAFPLDELEPMSCSGHDTLGSYSLTLVDTLDALLVSVNVCFFKLTTSR
jgi:mannosidase alpha-like ER degradation enhancer 2